MLDFFARWYASKLQQRLGRMGLTYHDAIAETGVYEKALSRLPPQMQVERMRRMKRAMDMSSKHVEMPKDAMVRANVAPPSCLSPPPCACARARGGRASSALPALPALPPNPPPHAAA